MKVALVAHPAWFDAEAATLRHLAVGLVAHQVRVINVIPESNLNPELDMTGDVVAYRGRAPRTLSYFSKRYVVDQVRRLEPDLVHALDSPARGMAEAISRALGVPLVCSCWSRRSAHQLSRARSRTTERIAATGPLAHLARRRFGRGSDVVTVRPGVYGFDESMPAPLAEPDAALCALVIGPPAGQTPDPEILYGLAQAKGQLGSVMLFIYASTDVQRHYWQAARKLNLSDQVILVPRATGTMRLLMQCDVLIQPQATGQVRTMTLSAMAAGRPVLAATDPDLDFLIEDRTARLVAEPTGRRWAALLNDLASEPETYREMGRSAQRYVTEHHGMSNFVEGMVAVYRQAAPTPLPFDASGAEDGSGEGSTGDKD
ncbi:MAG: hypothetical protein CMJ49_08875 [Planctomycetaceae bacterium]|nr:hypothetical protein [Planctomycetaceae bacterium]